MKISVIGTGYVGLVAGACLADLGNNVICADVDAAKINMLLNGKIPIYEPGLEEIVQRNMREKRLSFSADAAGAIKLAQIVFIAVGTPQSESGKADLTYVLSVAKQIGENFTPGKIIVDKSTVPVGTSRKVKQLIERISNQKAAVVSNPEFLREGSAVADFLKPDRVVIGSDDEAATKAMLEIYRPLGCEILLTSPESAELIKYASNAFLATKISFINEIANLCERTGADVGEVARGMGLDKRIGKDFLNAGCGYGGSCFPKDVQALRNISNEVGYEFRIIEQVENVNSKQKLVPFEKLKNEPGSLKGKKIVLLGLAFKPNTDDMREASSIEICKALSRAGANIVAIDRVARKNAEKILKGVEYSDSPYDASKGADAIILVTEWNEFRELDFKKIGPLMKTKLLIDGRNIYDKKLLNSLGFKYIGVGR